MKRIISTAILSVLLSLFCLGCGDTSTSPSSSGKISAGKEVELIQQNIMTIGGKIVISSPNDAMDGLTLVIPSNSYNDNRTFRITSAPITGHSLGALFHPVSPLITISNGGGYADSIMTLTIPVHVPNGQFAMAFMYDPNTGELEGLPISESNSSRVTVHTRHFARSTMGNLGKGIFLTGDDVDFTQIVVSSIDTAELMSDYNTPFKPGVDDFQFVNWGSYAEEGHCSGQSIGMLWYYTQKKLNGSPQLFGRFDNDGIRKTPYIWQDDVLGYKFCAKNQLQWSYSNSNNLLEFWQGKNDVRSMYAFSYALRITNQPQLVIIYPSDKTAPHAMVVYGITRGTLLICDPNYPGIPTRKIRFDEFNHIFQPYFFGVNAGDPGKQYPTIHYLAKSAVASWTAATENWKNVANGTIGNDIFPEYSIYALNEQDDFVPLTDGFTVPLGGRLTLSIRGKGFPGKFRVFSNNESEITKDGSSVQLSPGSKLIGIYVSDTLNRWIGFKWVNITVPGEEMQGTPSGYLQLNLYFNGVKVDVDSAKFQFSRLIDIYDFKIDAFIKNGIPFTHNYFSLYINHWYGGKYDGPVNSLYSGISLYGDANYSLYEPDFGNCKITEWGDQKVEGTFSYIAYTEDRKKSVTCVGDFHFLK